MKQPLKKTPKPLTDVQNTIDHRGLGIDQVGVCDLRYPISVLDRKKKKQETIATVSLSVNLPHHFKGTHMSRFIKVLNRHRGEVTMRTIPAILSDLKKNLHAESAHIELCFPYFIEKVAPLSGEKALMDYECTFAAESNGDTDDFILGVVVPVMSLCPCSKAISEYGAHNQRGSVSIQVRSVRSTSGDPELIWIEELIEVAENSASSPVYPLLKREDEKYVTEHAFENPVFVEDIVRNSASKLDSDPRVAWFSVRAVNQESIHNHSAFASIIRQK